MALNLYVDTFLLPDDSEEHTVDFSPYVDFITDLPPRDEFVVTLLNREPLWITLSEEEKENMLRASTLALHFYNWSGQSMLVDQPLSWPRVDVNGSDPYSYFDPSYNQEIVVDYGYLPERIKTVMQLYILHLVRNDFQDVYRYIPPTGSGPLQIKIGDIEYTDPGGTAVIQHLSAVLNPLEQGTNYYGRIP